MFLLFATLVGSIFNIPVAELPPERIVFHEAIHFFGMRYRVPVVTHWAGTVIAVNVGGAVIPTLMSAYLLIKRELWVKGLIATAVVALVIHWMADPVPGLGIAVPVFVPALVTTAVALLLSRKDAPPLAYIAGGLGTLIGADLTNLDKVRGLGAPVASIGGAGTFDGIFLTGILAVLLALHATPCTLNTAAELSLTIHLLRLEPPREAASFALSALPSPYHQCERQKMAGRDRPHRPHCPRKR
jgi:uncharacterized membrane protein